MSKGRAQCERDRARMLAHLEQKFGLLDRSRLEISGGEGGDAYLTPTQENQLIDMAVNGDWPTGAKEKQKAVDTTMRNMDSENGRVSNGAVSNLIRMEAQKMGSANSATQNTQVNVSGNLVVNGTRRRFWTDMGEILADTPEQKRLIAARMRQEIEASEANGQSPG